MTDETIKLLAAETQTPVECLLQQFADAGIKKTENDIVTQKDKEILLVYLNRKDGIFASNHIKKLSLQRKTRSILSVLSTSGKSKSVNIEVRKKRIYVNHDILLRTKIKEQLKYKHEREDEINYEAEKKEISKVLETEKIKQNNNHKAIKWNNDSIFFLEKHHSEFTITDPKDHVKEEIQCKVETKTKRITKEVKYMEKENFNYWSNSYEIEDDNDIHEDNHITRNRNIKISNKQKKNNKRYEKIDREEEKSISRASKIKGNKQKKNSLLQQSFIKPVTVINRDIIIGETISVSELANKMAVKSSQVIKTMMKMGAMVTINQIVDQETAQLVAEEMGHKVILRRGDELEKAILYDREITDKIIPETRAPVVTIMGHVDHGKTSLLDYIRLTKIAPSEAGGITQHIGAYHVKTDKGIITFLDTPGHAAFTLMRARGIKITDIVVLVIAADDGVMPQTIEAIQHAKAANVPIVVAINKIDKREADPDRIKNNLLQYDILAEDWGGETQFVHVSAKTGIGINALLEAILLQAELLELKAVHIGMAKGVVIDSYLDKGRGSVATILVQNGTLNKGDIVLCGVEYGRIRAMRNEVGENIQSAGPSIPVEILGLSNVPSVGDEITVVRDERKAREVALYRQGKFREIKLARQQKLKSNNIFSDMEDDKISELNVILKTDVQGSCEAIIDSLKKLSTNEVKIKIIVSGVGAITETDATLAAASNAIIIGFNIRADTAAKRIIESENLDLRYYSVIYNLIDEIKQLMSGMLAPEYKQQIIGLAEVRNIFKLPKFGVIAGCMVIEGIIKRNNPIHILRDNVVIYKGELESLRRFKDDINEVRNGMECGIGIKNYNDIHINDIIEVFEVIEIKRFIDN